jgi:hypothetical protein
MLDVFFFKARFIRIHLRFSTEKIRRKKDKSGLIFRQPCRAAARDSEGGLWKLRIFCFSGVS